MLVFFLLVVRTLLVCCKYLRMTTSIKYLLTLNTAGTTQELLLRLERVRSILINPSVCLSVCLSVRKHIFGTAKPIFAKFCMWFPCGRGSVTFQRRCATLCISGFMDDVSRLAIKGRMALRGWPDLLLKVSYFCAIIRQTVILSVRLSQRLYNKTTSHSIILIKIQNTIKCIVFCVKRVKAPFKAFVLIK